MYLLIPIVVVIVGLLIGNWVTKHNVSELLVVPLCFITIVGMVLSVVITPLVLIVVWVCFKGAKSI